MAIITFILGLVIGAGGYRYWARRKSASQNSGVTIQGGGGPGEEPGP